MSTLAQGVWVDETDHVPKLIVAGPVVSVEHELAGHPERPSRVGAAAAGIDDLKLDTDRVEVGQRLATFDELAAVYDVVYLRELETFCAAGGGKLDPHQYASLWSPVYKCHSCAML